MTGDHGIDCEPLAAYQSLYDRFADLADDLGVRVSEGDLRLSAWVALDELLAMLAPQPSENPAILRNDLPEPSQANLERALALASTRRIALHPPLDAPDAVRSAYRMAEGLLTAIWATTTVH